MLAVRRDGPRVHVSFPVWRRNRSVRSGLVTSLAGGQGFAPRSIGVVERNSGKLALCRLVGVNTRCPRRPVLPTTSTHDHFVPAVQRPLSSWGGADQGSYQRAHPLPSMPARLRGDGHRAGHESGHGRCRREGGQGRRRGSAGAPAGAYGTDARSDGRRSHGAAAGRRITAHSVDAGRSGAPGATPGRTQPAHGRVHATRGHDGNRTSGPPLGA